MLCLKVQRLGSRALHVTALDARDKYGNNSWDLGIFLHTTTILSYMRDLHRALVRLGYTVWESSYPRYFSVSQSSDDPFPFTPRLATRELPSPHPREYARSTLLGTILASDGD